MIIPHSAICTDRMSTLIEMLRGIGGIWLSTYSIRPSKLFEGADQRLAIYVASGRRTKQARPVFSSKYHHWHSEYRPALFEALEYADVTHVDFSNSIPKIGTDMENKIWEKLLRYPQLRESYAGSSTAFTVYFHNAPRYWIRALDFIPYFWNQRDGERASSQIRRINFRTQDDALVAVAALNSSLFFWWFLILSDCRHLNLREIDGFPLGMSAMSKDIKRQLVQLTARLMEDYKSHSQRKQAYYRTTGQVVYDEFYPRYSKGIIDLVDQALARHFVLSPDELDFIINYDIKYRMGAALEEGQNA